MDKFKHFGKLIPVHVSVNWDSFEEFMARSECPLFHRPEFCERCDGEPPVCPRVLLRPIHDADPIGMYVSEYMSNLNL